ncbi:MAG: choice-of-anchor J domain-containing protein [Bacteroidales bacterium]|nr:choice-of-anchor J domain-containing protein [Bacteroidales bacterium]
MKKIKKHSHSHKKYEFLPHKSIINQNLIFMKKVLLFVAAIFAVVALNAQTYLLQESFDAGSLPTGWITLDQDGDGYTWDAETPLNAFTTHTGASCIASASYINNVGALTPDNWLITPALAIPASGSTVLSWWATGQDASDYAEHYEVLFPLLELPPVISTQLLFMRKP